MNANRVDLRPKKILGSEICKRSQIYTTDTKVIEPTASYTEVNGTHHKIHLIMHDTNQHTLLRLDS